ncbi:hypothetical protein JOQ06_000477 [Pogonophryne albipinna]|uniref:Uncharacterized protein n=1 Tax=Pogonophryne albipinna TaxID=1090488 RepID=A0AAD6F835_9TELE|nr:hypothetical protein JOQ06_000477 [Pogonophryne albipinna]
MAEGVRPEDYCNEPVEDEFGEIIKCRSDSHARRWQQRQPLALSQSSERLCEMLAMKMNVWEQIRLFLGDLSLALYERGSKQNKDGVEGSEDDLTHMEFLGHYRPEEEVCVEVIMSLAVRDPTGTPSIQTLSGLGGLTPGKMGFSESGHTPLSGKWANSSQQVGSDGGGVTLG